MKKTIILFLGFIIIFTNYTVPQKHSDFKESRYVTNEEIAKLISKKSNFGYNHPFTNFFNKYLEVAILYQLECGIPVSIQFAQAITESGGGNSQLGKLANNLFGMKYYKEIFNGECFIARDGSKWRKYPNFESSFQDHAQFLYDNYNHAVGKDWKYWVNNCRGYGANGYWNHIGKVIEMYKLHEYDTMVTSQYKNYK